MSPKNLSGIVSILLVWLLLTQTHTHPQPLEKLSTRGPLNTHRREAVATQQETLTNFQNSDFYHTIIDNNLFRPLGWTPPRPIEPYRLLGTLVARDANTPPRAILQTTAGNKTQIVTTGEKLDADTEIVEIRDKQVTLETNGQTRTLHLPSGF